MDAQASLWARVRYHTHNPSHTQDTDISPQDPAHLHRLRQEQMEGGLQEESSDTLCAIEGRVVLCV